MNKVQFIPVDKIRVLNPRARSKAKFTEIVDNIAKVGLKKPITVCRRASTADEYDLVCGQGRLEACAALGYVEIPAIVVEATRDERYIMSLVENVARRLPRSLECAHEIRSLRERGYTNAQIAEKLGVSESYVSVLDRLVRCGEERLLQAVERGEVPLNIAAEIAGAEDPDVQRSLTQAYESGKLRGAELLRVRKLVEQRQLRGKSLRGANSSRGSSAKPLTPDALVRTYNKEVERQSVMVKKARLCETRLTFLQTALGHLYRDDDFVNLLRAEGLETAPKYLQDRVLAGAR